MTSISTLQLYMYSQSTPTDDEPLDDQHIQSAVMHVQQIYPPNNEPLNDQHIQSADGHVQPVTLLMMSL